MCVHTVCKHSLSHCSFFCLPVNNWFNNNNKTNNNNSLYLAS